MLNIRIPKERDKKKISSLLREENIKIGDLDDDKLNKSMVVCDGDEIIGYGSYFEISDKTAFIDALIIKREYRRQYMGDGLIKALLNLADKRKIKRVYIIDGNNNSLFYKKVGLAKRKLDVSEDILKCIGNELKKDETVEVFEAILPDFFNKACKSHC
ncbi:GNAT family N-acetyltransferase [Paramaledivibacter caminithermalis]|jgi:amino-acid N-acetyltransferase|uniref:Amino-acid N-acetyltransferase n=1 Tax=Paramaledivibacter caminithermalis (strain DSM 15212 / CIP 107654 / DViRD3) TaxID=1121301 RepID=A0A1M6JN92_PARC5|nr:GNAT family N-acetyltransferase [Paramaledivibacter caminithermalis]SHJ48187.1 amino-acid N-acetyltransferase [Paramaledivibacter caminithermalis DSM 15212]